jgi:hypothetical protein
MVRRTAAATALSRRSFRSMGLSGVGGQTPSALDGACGIDAKRLIEFLKQKAAGNVLRRPRVGVLDAGAATRVALKPR